MSEKPELIAYTYNLLGGSASFYKNLFSNNPDDFFNVKGVILEYNWKDHVPPISELKVHKSDVLLKVKFRNFLQTSYKITKEVSNKKGLIVCSDTNELIGFDLFRKKNKTLYFICHDDAYLASCKKFDRIVDVFIAHNFSVYENIIELIPHRRNNVFFIPHGIEIKNNIRIINKTNNLKIVFLARNHIAKGIFDLIEINKILLDNKLTVEWNILGNGPERETFKEKVKNHQNFNFLMPIDQSSLYDLLKNQDIFILPSRLDGLPVSLLETMSQGCVPVISRFNEGILKVVTNDVGFVNNIGNNMEFAEKILLLNNDRELLYNMSKQCSLKIKNEYDINNQAKMYFDLFKQFETYKRPNKINFKDIKRILKNFNTIRLTYNKIVYKKL